MVTDRPRRDTPELVDLWGSAFDEAYRATAAQGCVARRVRARDLYARMMRTLAQTGNGWMTFKDAANQVGNQTAKPGNVIHLLNGNSCAPPCTPRSDSSTA